MSTDRFPHAAWTNPAYMTRVDPMPLELGLVLLSVLVEFGAIGSSIGCWLYLQTLAGVPTG